MNNYRKAFVYVDEKFAGILKETENGYSFIYDREYLKINNAMPVSLTLPLRNEEYTSKVLFSFFDGLIPEGYLLKIAEKNWKLDSKDRFGILLKTCNDPIGNVTLKEVK